MNIKKIIRESIDEFDWVRDSIPIDLTRGKWIIRNNNPDDMEENLKIQKFLYSIGYKWTAGLTIDDMLDEPIIYYVSDHEPFDDHFDGYGSDNPTIQRVLDSLIEGSGFTLYEWGAIKNLYNID
jgi:hypothetical protein